jgi:hypothetical protein
MVVGDGLEQLGKNRRIVTKRRNRKKEGIPR